MKVDEIQVGRTYCGKGANRIVTHRHATRVQYEREDDRELYWCGEKAFARWAQKEVATSGKEGK